MRLIDRFIIWFTPFRAMTIVALLLDIVVLLMLVSLVQVQQDLEAERQKPPTIERVVEYRYITTKQVVNAIAKWETASGTTGMGRSHCNNPTGISGKCFETLAEGYQYSYKLWEQSYSQYDLTTALARWKLGDQHKYDRTQEILDYVNKIQGELVD